MQGSAEVESRAVAACRERRCSRVRNADPNKGAGIDDLLPAETVAELKGRDMMVGRFAELLGLST